MIEVDTHSEEFISAFKFLQKERLPSVLVYSVWTGMFFWDCVYNLPFDVYLLGAPGWKSWSRSCTRISYFLSRYSALVFMVVMAYRTCTVMGKFKLDVFSFNLLIGTSHFSSLVLMLGRALIIFPSTSPIDTLAKVIFGVALLNATVSYQIFPIGWNQAVQELAMKHTLNSKKLFFYEAYTVSSTFAFVSILVIGMWIKIATSLPSYSIFSLSGKSQNESTWARIFGYPGRFVRLIRGTCLDKSEVAWWSVKQSFYLLFIQNIIIMGKTCFLFGFSRVTPVSGPLLLSMTAMMAIVSGVHFRETYRVACAIEGSTPTTSKSSLFGIPVQQPPSIGKRSCTCLLEKQGQELELELEQEQGLEQVRPRAKATNRDIQRGRANSVDRFYSNNEMVNGGFPLEPTPFASTANAAYLEEAGQGLAACKLASNVSLEYEINSSTASTNGSQIIPPRTPSLTTMSTTPWSERLDRRPEEAEEEGSVLPSHKPRRLRRLFPMFGHNPREAFSSSTNILAVIHETEEHNHASSKKRDELRCSFAAFSEVTHASESRNNEKLAQVTIIGGSYTSRKKLLETDNSHGIFPIPAPANNTCGPEPIELVRMRSLPPPPRPVARRRSHFTITH